MFSFTLCADETAEEVHREDFFFSSKLAHRFDTNGGYCHPGNIKRDINQKP